MFCLKTRYLISVLFLLKDQVGSQGNPVNYIALETEIHSTIFKGYNKLVVPHLNRTTPIEVNFSFSLRAIDDVDIKAQTMTLRAYIGLWWTDDLLRWDPKTFGNIPDISITAEDVWTPYLTLIDSAESEITLTGGEYMSANYRGLVLWYTIKKFKIPCRFDISTFAFDEQVCPLTFESWQYSSAELAIYPIDVGDLYNYKFTENTEWSLRESSLFWQQYDYDGYFYDQVLVNVKVKRKYLYALLYTALPVICTSLLSITCFIVPAENGERVSLSVSLFLALAVLMTIVDGALPNTSDQVSYFGLYVSLQLFWSGLTVCLTSISTSLYFTPETTKLPFLWTIIIACTFLKPVKVQQNSKNKRKRSNESNCFEEPSIEIVKMTWKNVSFAFDRICFLVTVMWHIILHLSIAFTLLT